MAAPQAFLDILANAQVRDAYLAGRVAIILSSDLETVLWANGAGARFMGFASVAESLAGQSVFNAITRRLISHALKSGKAVSVRGERYSEQFLANTINLEPWGDVVFLRSAAAAVDSRGQVDLTEGLSDETSEAAVFDLSGQIMYADKDARFALSAEPGLRALLKEAYADGAVKKRLLGSEKQTPVGVLRLSKKPPIFLVIAAKHPLEDSEEKAAEPAAAKAAKNGAAGAETMIQDTKNEQTEGNLRLSRQEQDAFFAIAQRLQNTLQRREKQAGAAPQPQEDEDQARQRRSAGEPGDGAPAEIGAEDMDMGTADILAELTASVMPDADKSVDKIEKYADADISAQHKQNNRQKPANREKDAVKAQEEKSRQADLPAEAVNIVSLSARKAENTRETEEKREEGGGEHSHRQIRMRAAAEPMETAEAHISAQAAKIRHMAAQMESLCHQNKRLSFLLNTVSESVLILDKNGKIAVCNAAAARLFGYEQGALCGQNFAVLFAPPAADFLQDTLKQAAEREDGVFLGAGHEAEGRASSGSALRLRVNFGCLEPGRHYFLLMRDMTRFHDIIAALLRKNAEDAQAVRRQSRLSALMSHEMRTPLNAILGMAEFMASERAGALDNAKYKEYLEDILRAGNHIMALVNDSLHLSQNRADWLHMKVEPIALTALLNEALRFMIPQANAASLIVRTGVPNDLPPILADARSVKQILLNVLSNAVRFTPAEGQIIISAHELSAEQAYAYGDLAEKTGKNVSKIQNRPYILLRIGDSGIGMSAAEIAAALRDPLEPERNGGEEREREIGDEEGQAEHIADSAAEADESDYGADADYNALKLRMKGAGIGLPMAYALAEANNIIFLLRSEQGKGTEVTLLFPVAEQ